MKKTHLLFIIIIAFVGFSNAQQEKIIGSWLVTQVEIAGEIEQPYLVADYTEDGKMKMMGMEVATWEYNKKTNEIEMKSDFDKDFNGNNKIIKLTNKELVLVKDEIIVTYQKLDLKKIATANKNSGLIGTWVFKGVPYSYANSTITFKEPNEFTIIEKQEGMESTLKGMWMFKKKQMSLIMIGLRGEDTFKGKNNVIKINEEVLEIANKTNVYTASKKAISPLKVESSVKVESIIEVEHLSFTYEDFTTDDGNYKYNREVDKLPWKDYYLLVDQISDIKQLVYSYDNLTEETNTFETKMLKADVFIEEDNQRIRVDNVFYGFDRYNIPEDSFFPENDENGNADLYPLSESMYRVVGQEELTLNIGTFNCTVVEALSGIEKLKIWLMNDKPAIIAKLIKESEESNDQYSIYELQEIIYN